MQSNQPLAGISSSKRVFAEQLGETCCAQLLTPAPAQTYTPVYQETHC